MNDPTTNVLDPLPDLTTLDGDTADRFGTFLAVEAAADAASTRSTSSLVSTRRVIGGLAAASVLAGGLLLVNGVVGGPGPAAVDPAVAIEQADGWTTISITDPDASPAEIEAALEAVGIDARIETGGVHPGTATSASGEEADAAPGIVSFYGATVTTGDPSTDDHRASYGIAAFGGPDADPGELTGLSLDFAVPDDMLLATDGETVSVLPEEAGSLGTADITPFEEGMEELGIKTGGDLPDGTVSIRDGSDVEVVLSAQP